MNIREIIAWFENKRKTLLKSLSYGQKISMLLGLGIIVGLSGLFFYLLQMLY